MNARALASKPASKHASALAEREALAVRLDVALHALLDRGYVIAPGANLRLRSVTRWDTERLRLAAEYFEQLLSDYKQ